MAYVKGLDLEKLICQVIFRNDTSELPATFYVGVGVGGLPVASAALIDLVEPSGAGYSRLALNRDSIDFPTLALSSSHWKVSSKVLTWIAGADWVGDVDFVFLTDVASGTVGKFYGAVTVVPPFPMLDGDTYNDTFEYQDR